MTEEQRKIQQLEQDLTKLSSQIDLYRQQINELKNDNGSILKEEGEEETIKPSKKPAWELRSYSPSSLNLENFIGLRLLHLTGIVVLVIGISIGVKYAVDKEMISPVTRIILAYAAGTILYFLSLRLKKKFELFSAILFSGAMASLYFTTYAAFVYYNLFPFAVSFALMVAITIYTAYTAIQYDKQEIAILGMIGSYGIPFLISSNADRIDLFFAYIILINCGIVFLSYKKIWKAMVRLAMLLSWTLFIGWAISKYNPAMQVQVVVIMCIFYCLFAIAAVLFPISKKLPLGILELQLLLSNNLLAYIAALLVFTEGNFDSRSVMVTGIGCLIFSLQAVGVRLIIPKEKLLFKYLTAFAILSLVFYVGMKWDGVLVTITWLVIAIGLFAAGVMTKMGWLRLFAILLTGVTLGKLILIDRNSFTTGQKIISYISIGVLLLLLSFFYQKLRQTFFPEPKK